MRILFDKYLNTLTDARDNTRETGIDINNIGKKIFAKPNIRSDIVVIPNATAKNAEIKLPIRKRSCCFLL